MRRTLVALLALTIGPACVQRAEIGEILNEPQGDAGAAGAQPMDLELERFANPISAASQSSCAITSAGGLACWGSNAAGELGIGDEQSGSSLEPVMPIGLGTGVHATFGGGVGHCAMRDTGRVACWGYVFFGLFNGEPTYASVLEPFEMPFISDNTVQVTVGAYWLCLLTKEGLAKCWGAGANGQLGNGSTMDSYVPTDVTNVAGERYVELDSGGFHNCGVTSTGGVMCWGFNSKGQLGEPGPDRLEPVAAPIEDVRHIAAGTDHTCATKHDGSVWCWGDDSWGQLGGVAPPGPAAVPGLPSAGILAAGGTQTCTITADSSVWCWGEVQPFEVSAPSELVEAAFGTTGVACGLAHCCATNANHLVRCWGENLSGQTGLGQFAL